MKNVFDKNDCTEFISRIQNLTVNTQAVWGTMTAGQMLAHCCISYEMVYDNKHSKSNFFIRFLLKLFVKKAVVNDVPYKQSLQTAPAFKIKEDKNFELQKNRLIAYIEKTQVLGADYFDDKESLSFGPLSKKEWNNLFAKHLDHHLNQFGV